MSNEPVNWQHVKRELRARAFACRRKQEGKQQLSRQICRKLAALPEYLAADTVMSYVDFRSEVRTRHFLQTARRHGKRIVVPYCDGGQLGLFLLEGLDELAPGSYRILEPEPRWRGRTDRKVDVAELDLIVIPGVAFDRKGGRLGRGKGYYDRFLPRTRKDAASVALAFECQLFDRVPMQPHDVYMDKVITENAVCQREKPS
jgi:5-formyltetrahydrofolate cyclo-ligase